MKKGLICSIFIVSLILLSSCMINSPNRTNNSANFKFVAAGDNGICLTSADGKDWTKKSKCGTTFLQISAVIKNTGVAEVRHISMNDGSVAQSDNEQGSIIVATSLYDVYSSSDGGITWIHRYNTGSDIRKMITVNGVFLIVGGGTGYILRSEDGIDWEPVVSGGSLFNSITYGNGVITAVGSGDRVIQSSDNGVTWENDNGGNGYQEEFNGIAYGNGIFVGVGRDRNGFSGRWATSTNGQTWENDTTDFTLNMFFDIAFGNGVFVAVGNRIIMTSTDGVNWTNKNNLEAEVRSVTYSESKFIIVGSSTQDGTPIMRISEDAGVTWQDLTVANDGEELQDVSTTELL